MISIFNTKSPYTIITKKNDIIKLGEKISIGNYSKNEYVFVDMNLLYKIKGRKYSNLMYYIFSQSRKLGINFLLIGNINFLDLRVKSMIDKKVFMKRLSYK